MRRWMLALFVLCLLAPAVSNAGKARTKRLAYVNAILEPAVTYAGATISVSGDTVWARLTVKTDDAHRMFLQTRRISPTVSAWSPELAGASDSNWTASAAVTEDVVVAGLDTTATYEARYYLSTEADGDTAIGYAQYLDLAATGGTAPVARGILGHVVNDSSLVIMGFDFGTKNPAAPLVHDSFDSYSLATLLSAVDTLGSPFTHQDTYPAPTTLASIVAPPAPRDSRGNRCARFIYDRATSVDGRSDMLYFNSAAFHEARNIYFDAWHYMTVPSPWTPGVGADCCGYQHKLFGISNVGGHNNYTYLFWQLNEFISPGGSVFSTTQWEHSDFISGNAAMFAPWPNGGQGHYWNAPYCAPPADGGTVTPSWKHFRMVADTGTKGVNAPPYTGSLKFYVGNTLAYSNSFQPYQAGQTQELNELYLGWCASNAGSGRMYAYWDNVYADTTAARVEIGNASTYAACSVKEVQVPSAWAAGSITVTVQQGSFHLGDAAWLYVTDAEGTVSNGYPVIIGASVAKDLGGSGYKIIDLAE